MLGKGSTEFGVASAAAAITRAILQGEQGHRRNAVLLNAGAALYLGGQADTMQEGVALAAHCIDTGKAMETLERFLAGSNREGVGA